MSALKQILIPSLFTQYYKTLRPFDKDLCRELESLLRSLDGILNMGLSFADNMDARLVSVTSHATPGTEFSVAHTLGKIPTGYIIYRRTKAGSLYDGSSSNTASTLYLKSDASSGVFYILIF